MIHDVLIELAIILILGVGAQWLAWRIKLPSILLLLAVGILVGPVTGMIQPDHLLGNLLLPMVSLSVAVILYEGGLNLDLREIRNLGRTVFLMISLGAAVSWVFGGLLAHYLLGFEWPIAILLGAILVVTGPTVVGPILRHLRLRGKVGALLKWEGILIDPIGATLAVLIFSVIQVADLREGLGSALVAFIWTLVSGVGFGLAAGWGLTLALSRFWTPDYLRNGVSLMLMVAAFAASNHLQEESGLLAVTVMGMMVANQKRVSIHGMIEFKETLTVLLVSILFIVLSARLTPEDLKSLNLRDALFVCLLVVIARPLSVLAATIGSPLSWRERAFLACIAPRGIVAASVSSVFALSLVEAGYPDAVRMAPVTFLVVLGTVLFSGLTASPLSRRLGLVWPNPQGVLFVGANPWARAMASALASEKIPAFLVDTDWAAVRQARMAGLRSLYGSAISQQSYNRIDMSGLGRMMAVTGNNEINSLACMHFAKDFGWRHVYQLPFPSDKQTLEELLPRERRGDLLFAQELNFRHLVELAGDEPRIKKTRLSQEFDYEDFRAQWDTSLIPVFVIKPDGLLHIRTLNKPLKPEPGDLIISLVRQSEADRAGAVEHADISA